MLSNHLSCPPPPIAFDLSQHQYLSGTMLHFIWLSQDLCLYGLSLNTATKTQMVICLLIVAAGFPVSDRGGSKGEVRGKGGNLSSLCC